MNFIKKIDYKLMFVFGFISVMLGLVIYAIYHGVNQTDEALYIAMPYKVVLGQRFFFDEYLICQTGSFFIYPFIKLFVYLNNSTNGIFLFARYLHLGANILLAGLIFQVFRKITTVWAALLLALTDIVFTPFFIHGLSYDTLAILFATAGYFLGFLCVFHYQQQPTNSSGLMPPHWLIFFAGIFHAFLIISYPTLLLSPLVFMPCLFFYLPKWKIFIYYCLGLLLGGSWFFLELVHVGITQLLNDIHYVESFGIQLGGIKKLETVIIGLWNNFPNKTFIAFVTIVFFYINKYAPKLRFLFPIVAITCLFCTVKRSGLYGDMFFMYNIGLLAPIFLLLLINIKKDLQKNNLMLQLFILIWIPSFIAGFITAWTSANAALNFIIGFSPAVLVSFYYMLALTDHKNSTGFNINFKNPSVLGLVIGIVFICSLEYFNFEYTYSDAAPSQLHSRLNNGPFQGIYTTEISNRYYTQLNQDLKTLSSSHSTILFFDNFDVGYLFSNMLPATNSIWLCSPCLSPKADRYATIKYFEKNHYWPDLIVKINYTPAIPFLGESCQDPLVKLAQSYNLILKRSEYNIYQRKKIA